MRFRDRTTGQIYNSIFEIQQKFPNVSFPQIWDDSTYAFANVDVITEVPEPDVHIHNRVEYAGVQLINGKWTDVWIELPKYDNPTQQAEWVAQCIELKWDKIRTQRNQLLWETDYTQLPDTPISTEKKTEYTTYRQQLRDLPQQTSSPDDIVWPTRPS